MRRRRPAVKVVATVAGLVLLIAGAVGFALVVLVAFPGSSMNADTQAGATFVLVLALLVASSADVLLIAGLRQPPPRRMRYRKRTTRAALFLASPLIFLVVLIARVVTRLRRAPGGPPLAAVAATTMDEGSTGSAGGRELPGIAAMLVHSVPLRWQAAFMATLIDLAVHGHAELAERSGGLPWCRAPGAATSGPVAAFERLLLDHVVRRLAAGDAPVQALVPDHQDQDGNRWFRGFESAVLDEAHRRSLAGDPRSRPILWPFMSEARSRGADPAAVRRWLEMRDMLQTRPGARRIPESGAAVDDPSLAWAIALGRRRRRVDDAAATGTVVDVRGSLARGAGAAVVEGIRRRLEAPPSVARPADHVRRQGRPPVDEGRRERIRHTPPPVRGGRRRPCGGGHRLQGRGRPFRTRATRRRRARDRRPQGQAGRSHADRRAERGRSAVCPFDSGSTTRPSLFPTR